MSGNSGAIANHGAAHGAAHGYYAYRTAVLPTARLTEMMANAGDGIADFAAIVRRLVDAYRRRRHVHRSFAEFAKLDDHMLRDIGVCRTKLPVVAQAFAEDPEIDVRGWAG